MYQGVVKRRYFTTPRWLLCVHDVQFGVDLPSNIIII